VTSFSVGKKKAAVEHPAVCIITEYIQKEGERREKNNRADVVVYSRYIFPALPCPSEFHFFSKKNYLFFCHIFLFGVDVMFRQFFFAVLRCLEKF